MDNFNEFTKNKYSKKHHFLPVFYLKGFSDNNEKIFVYDKVKDDILVEQNPESKFYEKHLNNFRHKGEVKFTLEEPYFNPLDSMGSQLFAKVRNPEFTFDNQLTGQEQFEMIDYITRLFWRLPESNKVFLEIINKEGLSELYLSWQNENQIESLSNERIELLKKEILNNKELQKIFKHQIPFSKGTTEEINRLSDKWMIYSNNIRHPMFITGDNPFLINNDDIRSNNLFNELIFPIGKNKVLALSNRVPSFIDEILLTHINLSILHQSKRFIATNNQEELKQLLNYYNQYVKKNLLKDLIKETFKLMYYQSTFITHDEYLKDYNLKKEKYYQK